MIIRRFLWLASITLICMSSASGVARAQLTISSPPPNDVFHSGDEICVDGDISWAGGTPAPFGVQLKFNRITLFGAIGRSAQDPVTKVWTGHWVGVSPHYFAPTVTKRTQYTITAQQVDAMGLTIGAIASVNIFIDP